MDKLYDVFESLAARMESSFEPETGDFVQDGIWCCGKCHTPKQSVVMINGKPRLLPKMCDCQRAAREAMEAQRAAEKERQRIKHLRKMGFPDEELSRWTFDTDDHANEKLSGVAARYVENYGEMLKRHKGLLLYGTVGTGKTFAACCIANALIDKGYPCMVTNFPRLVNTISGMYDGKQEYIDGLNKFSLLVIDDLASERDTEYMTEIVQQIIDARYRAGLPLIVTTNLTSEELKHPAETRKQRIYSRLFEMCLPVEVKGADRRQKKLIEDHKELKELLGL